ncbi:MAG TPA: tRNA uridine-5-carboxymethylaminomethyl(34) synthesis GTPase MnmE [bacterium]|jgi:tRNA modification GTPase|nr:tRNA uridine-5-carboxymethylaminomethyl(34) synthesis GTPase MnmE [Myxococcales bacterium]HPW45715.1 tRNA uridine-5-carboxymethylaminomethyl(34) synthesis GTPase MnmE [bacterium]HQC50656.1 tRNA uridine-5-carboxymethylaminomethyl(34) synthesis GTPase MnmE [bacterium]HQG12761.1 tRNA uridine-5-carboxymethylaminomethyl(34) synthesis GTPase MnmE [bacterium]HQH79889.1 tRNA uridine-5-carboxymethylaminomethyl(34) synthesis GTPase MnmE [bacterium]
MISNLDTIAAIATPQGFGGIGVVRISGPKSREILDRLWKGKVLSGDMKPRTLYLGELCCDGDIVDRVMAVYLPAPSTYTGQDMVEFSCHGSPIILGKLVDAAIAAGARAAGPGEFTRRAFLAGKMDLVQAEAVADLISATSEASSKNAARQMSGELSRAISAVSEKLLDLRSFLEASIDFPEEELPELMGSDRIAKMGEIVAELSKLSGSYKEGRIMKDGVTTVIAGPPNAGKSSIMNAITGESRAIVHHLPGTTRDVVESMITFGGYLYRLRDTAGLRDSACEVERIGVDRARGELGGADLVIYVIDGSRPLNDDERKMLSSLDPSMSIVVINKFDLPQVFSPSDVGEIFNGLILNVSAKTSEGIDGITSAMRNIVTHRNVSSEGSEIVTSARHKELLDAALMSAREADDAIADGMLPVEFIVESIRVSHEKIAEILGENIDDALLDRIFSSFCIGK